MSDRSTATETIRFVPVEVSGPVDGSGAIQNKPQLGTSYVVLGVVFPAFVIVFELATRLCAETFFDPMPTAWHAMAVSLVPLINWIVWARLPEASERELRWLVRGAGAAVTIAGCYTLLFLPLLPVAIIGILYAGLGLLPFGPLASFVCAIKLLGKAVESDRSQHLGRHGAVGLAIGLVALMAIDMPMVATRLGIQWAAGNDPVTRARGIALLRNLGDDDQLLRLCYGMPTRPAGPLGAMLLLGEGAVFGRRSPEISAPQATAREIYYRVHGAAFNQVRAPRANAKQQRFFNDFQFDSDLGGADVGGRVQGLTLTQSRLDGSISGDDAVAYLEWTFEFRNVAMVDREARLELALPPGAVVSRASLWINGEEKEAAYGGRGAVRAAYQKVAVQQRRDPLLVTTKGADRVLAQAFPVTRNGGTIKFKLGITAPLQAIDAQVQRLVLPAIFDRNFSFEGGVGHHVWIASRQPLGLSGGLVSTDLPDATHRISGTVDDRELSRRRLAITLQRNLSDTPRLARLGTGPAIVQTVASQKTTPATVHIVIDGSSQLADKVENIVTALASIPAGTRVGLSIAAEPVVALPVTAWSEAAALQARNLLRDHRFVGGQNNAAALAAALRTLESEPNGHLLWVHGPQPQVFQGAEAELAQAVGRIARLPALTLYPVVAGPNTVLPDVPWSWSAHMLPHVGSINDDLSRFLRTAAAGSDFTTQRHELDAANPPAGVIKGSEHIVRLWARDRVLAMMRGLSTAKDQEAVRSAAVKLAVETSLVTPVSGAVVLETQQQYDENRLTPVSEARVPTLPEPHEWALIGLAGLIACWLLGRGDRIPSRGMSGTGAA